MKLALKSETVFELFREMVGTDRYCDKGEAVCPRAPNPCYDPEADSAAKFDQTPGAENPGKKYIPFHGANYLVYDEHKDAPPGFALRVGRMAAVFLVDKRVKDKKLKIPVGLAAGKKGFVALLARLVKSWGFQIGRPSDCLVTPYRGKNQSGASRCSSPIYDRGPS